MVQPYDEFPDLADADGYVPPPPMIGPQQPNLADLGGDSDPQMVIAMMNADAARRSRQQSGLPDFFSGPAAPLVPPPPKDPPSPFGTALGRVGLRIPNPVARTTEPAQAAAVSQAKGASDAARPAASGAARQSPAQADPYASPDESPWAEPSRRSTPTDPVRAAQQRYLNLGSEREDVARRQEDEAIQAGRTVGTINATAMAEVDKHNRGIAKVDNDSSRFAADELKSLRTESDRVANMHVDPKAGLPRGSANELTTALAMLFALPLAVAGKRNPFMEMVNTELDRSIAVQEANIGNAKAGVARRADLYEKMRQKFGDDRAAKVATKDAYLGMVDRSLANQEALAKTAAGAAKFADARRVLGQQREADWLGFEKERQAQHAAAGAAQLHAQREAEKAALAEYHWQEEHKIKKQEADTKSGEGPGGQKDLMGRYSSAAGGVLQRPEQAAKFDEQAKAFDFVDKELRDIQNEAREIGLVDKLKPWDSNRVMNVRSRVQALIPVVTQVFGAGTPGEAEGKRALESMAGDPASFFGPDSVERMDSFMGTLARGKAVMSSSLGVVPARKVVDNGRERVELTGEQARTAATHGFKANTK